MWTGYLVISSGSLTLESPTLGEGGNRGPWVNPGGGVGWGGQARWDSALCLFSDQPENQQPSSSSPEPSRLPGIPSKPHAVWEVTGRR